MQTISRRNAVAVLASSSALLPQTNQIASFSTSTKICESITESIASCLFANNATICLIYDRTKGVGRIAHINSLGQIVQTIQLTDPALYTKVGYLPASRFYVWQKRLGKPPQVLEFTSDGQMIGSVPLDVTMTDMPLAFVGNKLISRTPSASINALDLGSRQKSLINGFTVDRADLYNVGSAVKFVDLIEGRVHTWQSATNTFQTVTITGPSITAARDFFTTRKHQYEKQSAGAKSTPHIVMCSGIQVDGSLGIIAPPMDRSAPVPIYGVSIDGSTRQITSVRLLGNDQRKLPPRWLHFPQSKSVVVVHPDGYIDTYNN